MDILSMDMLEINLHMYSILFFVDILLRSCSWLHCKICPLGLRAHVYGLRTTYGNEFSDAIYLCLGVHICPAPICDIRHPICDSDFSNLGGEKSDSDMRFLRFGSIFLLYIW